MKLDEILDKPAEFKVIRDDEESFTAKFMAGNREIIFVATSEDEGAWLVDFGEIRNVKRKMPGPGQSEYKQEINYGKTGSGNELEVFSTIKAILQKLIKERKPATVGFSASKEDDSDNRARLYARLLKKNLPSGWKIDKEDAGHGTTFFTMIREALDRPLPYTVTNKSKTFFDARFKAGDRWIDFTAQLYPKGEYWEITFEEQQERNSTTKVTGSGNEFQVFATVKAIITQFIEEYDPKEMTIDSHKGEPTRTRLYQRMIAKNMPSGWKARRNDAHPSYTTFTLVREGMMKRSDPWVSGDKWGPRPPDEKLAPKRTPTAHRSKLETLMRKSGKSMEKVEAAWNKAVADTPDGPKKWANVMIRAKADLGISI